MIFNTKSFRALFLRVTVVSLVIFGLLFANGAINAQAQAITEGFENVPAIFNNGWVQTNNSVPLGTLGWLQCDDTQSSIPPAQAGTTNSCIIVNFQSTGNLGTISNWLIAPTVTLRNGDTFSFYTRTINNNFPDRLQVRLSTNGASTNVGSTATSVGDFTTLLLDIDPNYAGTYPTVWTRFIVTVSGLSGPTSGRLAFRYFVENAGAQGANSNIIGIDTFVYTPAITPGDAPVDLNGDGKTDYVVARNTGGGANGQLTWFTNINGSTSPTNGVTWGLNSDVLVPADYDGDGKDDIAVWRPGAAMSAAFYILQSQTNTLRTEFFGQTGDDPTVVADYNNDGKDDVAVYRPGAQSVWYFRTTPNGPVMYVPWGTEGDRVAPGDFNGDGTADFGIARNKNGSFRYWRWLSTGVVDTSIVFGLSTDTVVTGDFDGDGKTDAATVRSEGGLLTWYWKPSSGGAERAVQFGSASDVPVPGDYDGDAKSDPGVFRNGIFYTLNSSSSSLGVFPLGSTGDRVPASYNTH